MRMAVEIATILQGSKVRNVHTEQAFLHIGDREVAAIHGGGQNANDPYITEHQYSSRAFINIAARGWKTRAALSNKGLAL